MPVLPSGRYVDIMSERARVHAARLSLRVSKKTPHHHLYPLIDILVEEPGESSSGYSFSGYTLADRNWICGWSEADRNAFFTWLSEPAQVRRIEQARGRLLAEKSLPREQAYRYPLRLYSMLRLRLESLPLQRASAQQWQRTLHNMQRDGLRREELNRSGVLGFLSRQPAEACVDKTAILGAIDFSAIMPRLSNELECQRRCRLEMHEVAEKMAPYQLRLAGIMVGERDIGVVRYRSAEHGYRIGVVWPQGRALHAIGRLSWFVLGPYGQVVEPPNEKHPHLFASPGEARQLAEQHAMRNHKVRCDLTYRARYEYLSLDGGEDYREWLVTLPDYQHTHFNGHFYERNILLHIRSKVRQTEQGERLLFIEELQSDWQQASLRYGSRGGVPQVPFRQEWASLAFKLMLLHAVEQKLDGIAWAGAEVHELRYDRELPPLRRLYDEELPRLAECLARPWGGRVTRGRFATRQPWLHAARCKESWKVEGGAGKFATRARYNKEQALALIARHSKAVMLELPLLRLPEGMRRYIIEYGLPLFGEKLD